jgi:hypothetical protein
MSQNRSSAVMQQRVAPRDGLDFFPTPPWATRALCERLKADQDLAAMVCWEPACGEGHMARPLSEYFGQVLASDVHPYGFGDVHDFLMPDPLSPGPRANWIVTNPPFRLAGQFIGKALAVAQDGIAVLVRSALTESVSRYEYLFRDHPPSLILHFAERVPMVKCRLDPNASTATAYIWMVWFRGDRGWGSGACTAEWIAPCRRRLERPGDYA